MRSLLLFVLALVTAPPCFGWGDLGHSVVGDIAERLIRPTTARRLRRILRPMGLSLAEAATWPDHMRSDADFKNTDIAKWHFVELDPQTNLPRDPINAIWGIELTEGILTGLRPPYSVPRKRPNVGSAVVIDQAKSVAFLAHLVGDLHQPLHVGNGHDHGANDCVVKWFGDVRRDEGFWNLHVVWDEGLLERSGFGRADFVKDLLRRLDRTPPQTFLNARSAGEWAQESAAVRPSVYPQLRAGQAVEETRQPYCGKEAYRNLPGKYAGAGETAHVIPSAELNRFSEMLFADAEVPRLGYDYRAQHIELARMQLLKAGVRLAFLLDRALDR